MKLIKMKTRAAGPDGVLLPEIEYSVDDKMAADLVAGGYAVEVKPPPKPKPAPKKRTPARKPAAKKTAAKKEVKSNDEK